VRMLRFSRLCLLSHHERRAFSLNLSSEATVLQAGNGFGKSAVLKSLYDALGAEPPRIDVPWRSAQVETLLDFTVDDVAYAVLSGRGSYGVFDAHGALQLRTRSVGNDLTEYLANLLDFRLEMLNRQEEAVTPPPAYMFAPFYIDQDASWKQPWASFKNFYLLHSPKTLAEYHSGLKSNEYYEAQARRNLLQVYRKALEAEREVLQQTLRKMLQVVTDVVLSFDLSDFQEESDQLLEESRKLNQDQSDYRQRLANISEERRLWMEQRDLVKATLAEMDENFAAALERPSEIACPTCGHHYDNAIADQFEIVQDKDGLYSALIISQEKLHELEAKAQTERQNIASLEERIARINQVLGFRKADVSFNDVLVAQGRNEAGKLIRGQIADIEDDIARKRIAEESASDTMRAALNRRRTDEIKGTSRIAYMSSMIISPFDLTRVNLRRLLRPHLDAAAKARAG
jgi:hypothetical protein